MADISYNGWSIRFNPKPIPDRRHDYDFVHEDYDGADGGNGLCGTAESVSDAIAQIIEIEEEGQEITAKPQISRQTAWQQ